MTFFQLGVLPGPFINRVILDLEDFTTKSPVFNRHFMWNVFMHFEKLVGY